MLKRRLPAILIAAAALLVWFLVAQRSAVRGPYRIGWEDDAPEMFRGPNGEPAGFAVDLVREAARRRRIDLQWVEHPESSEAALRSGAVDLWPLMTITPARLRFMHFSAPYVEAVVSVLVLRDSPYRRIEDLAGVTAGYRDLPITLKLVHQFLPTSRLVAAKGSHELIEMLCQKQIGVAFLEQDDVIIELMSSGSGCPGHGMVAIAAETPRMRLGVGSTLRASAAADAIRDEIDSLSNEGRLAPLFAKWGYLSGRNIAAVEGLLAARRREALTRVTAAVFAVLFLLALLQTVRYARQSARARRMQDNMRLLAHALRSANDCISITDIDTRILYVNDAFLRTYEYAENELIGQTAALLRCSSPGREVSAETAAAMAGESWRGELWNRTKSGREFPIALASSRVRDREGNFIARVAVASDITSRVRTGEQIKALSARLINAQEEERRRLARELHDDISQQIAALCIGMSNLRSQLPRESEPVLQQSQRLLQNLKNVAESVRSLSHELHPTLLIHSGLAAAVRGYCSEFTLLTQIQVACNTSGAFHAAPQEVSLCVYRVTQEALQNVAKHAHVMQAEVILTQESGEICLTISDCGAGMDLDSSRASAGLGLVSIQERTRLVNGTFHLRSQLNLGTTLTLTIPLK